MPGGTRFEEPAPKSNPLAKFAPVISAALVLAVGAAIVTSCTSSTPKEPAAPIEVEAVDKLKFGELLSISETDGIVAIKARIEPSYSNKATVDQNYFNVCEFIRSTNMEGVESVSYWAVAKMTSGNEEKVIAFDVPRATIDAILSGSLADNQLGDHVGNLFIHPSLQE